MDTWHEEMVHQLVDVRMAMLVACIFKTTLIQDVDDNWHGAN